jgi:iron(III) transport system substrate-binding protein
MRSAKKHGAAAAISILAVAALLTACSNGPADTGSSNPASGAQTAAELYKAAKAEGALTWYTSMPVATDDAVVAAFTAKYPGIKITYTQKAEGELYQQFEQEFYGGVNSADVINLSTYSNVVNAKKNDEVAKYVPPSVKDGVASGAFPKGTTDPKGSWFSVRRYVLAVMYNTNLVTGSDIPTTYEDFTKPFWKGKLGVGDAQKQAANQTLYYSLKASLGLGDDFWTKFAANKPTVFNDAGSFATALATGEIAGGTGIDYGGWTQRNSGAPIGVVYPATGAVYTSDFFMLAAQGPHPNAGKLLLDYLGSKEGASVVEKAGGYTMARTDITPASKRPATGDIKLLAPDFDAATKALSDTVSSWEKDLGRSQG